MIDKDLETALRALSEKATRIDGGTPGKSGRLFPKSMMGKKTSRWRKNSQTYTPQKTPPDIES